MTKGVLKIDDKGRIKGGNWDRINKNKILDGRYRLDSIFDAILEIVAGIDPETGLMTLTEIQQILQRLAGVWTRATPRSRSWYKMKALEASFSEKFQQAKQAKELEFREREMALKEQENQRREKEYKIFLKEYRRKEKARGH